MKLAKLEKNLPLRACPEENLNRVILMDLLPFLTGLLSLTDEVSAKRLEIALPAIKVSCIGMGFYEIKKMFEMYADSKLNLKPIPNYFDRILLGKIVTSYKSTKKPKKINIPEMTEQEKLEITNKAVLDSLECFIETRIVEKNAFNIYNILDEKGLMPKESGYKKEIFKDAVEIVKNKYINKKPISKDDAREIKLIIKNLNLEKTSGEVISKCKELALIDFFRILTQDKESVLEFKKMFKNK